MERFVKYRLFHLFLWKSTERERGISQLTLDYDLRIIQETRDVARKAKEAQAILATFTQEKLDEIVKAMCDAVVANAEWLARMACDETKYGVYEDKIVKKYLCCKNRL